MNRMRWRQGVFIFGVLFCLFSMTSIGSATEVTPLEKQVVELLNLGSEVEIERYGFENNQVLLWREPGDHNPEYAKNWGIVLLKNNQPHHLWFYTGPMTNTFQEFHPSFHQFTQDGRKELAIVGTDDRQRDWAYFFILNLEEQGVTLLHHGETNKRGGGHFVKADEVYNQGMFMDLDLDHIEELFVYREVQGSFLPGPTWPDIYNWEEGQFVKTNEKYPTFYIPFFEAFKQAAEREEQLADGNYRIFYEHLAQIYQIWDEPVGVVKARERAVLPPQSMGEQMYQLMNAAGYQTHHVVRADLDGMAPKDAMVWGKGIEGLRNQVWLVAQEGQELVGPFEVPLPTEFFQQSQEVEVRTGQRRVQFSYPADAQRSGRAYVYQFADTGVKLVGLEETQYLVDGRIRRKVAGRVLTEAEWGSDELLVQMPLVQAKMSQERIRVNGIFSEESWSEQEVLQLADEELIIQGVGQWHGQDDLSVGVQSLYDQENLYLSLRVTDDLKWYSQEQGLDRSRASDHVELWLEDQGQLYHYGIFLLSTGVEVIEWVDGQGQEPTHAINAQWMPASGGYWLEVGVSGLDLIEQMMPVTLGLVDVDQKDASEIETILATSTYQSGEQGTLGWIWLQR